jgi:NAD+ kinase
MLAESHQDARFCFCQVRMSTNPVPTISRTDQTHDWFASLERCFGWNDRAEQKPLAYIDRDIA